MIKYLDIYEAMKQRILNSEYPSNTKLPDGSTLAKEFKCSELTIKKALDILVSNGLIVRKRGSGSFVKQPLGMTNFKHLYGTKSIADTDHLPIETKVISFGVELATENLASRLNCAVGETLYRITRLRTIDGKLPKLEDCYMPTLLIPSLKLEHAEVSIYSYIVNKLNLKIHSSTLEISIVEATDFEVGIFNLSKNSHLVNVEQLVYLDSGEIFEYSNVKHLLGDFKFSTNIIKI